MIMIAALCALAGLTVGSRLGPLGLLLASGIIAAGVNLLSSSLLSGLLVAAVSLTAFQVSALVGLSQRHQPPATEPARKGRGTAAVRHG